MTSNATQHSPGLRQEFRGGFTLSEEYRSRLDSVAQQRYVAAENCDDERVTVLTEQLYTDPWGLGKGSGRRILPIPDTAYTGGYYDQYVVKLAHPAPEDNWDGIVQNLREATVWNDILAPDATGRSFLVPVTAVDPDGYWLIMPRGNPDIETGMPFHDWKASARYHLSEVIWEDDVSATNTVELDGAYQLCDYGIESNTSR